MRRAWSTFLLLLAMHAAAALAFGVTYALMHRPWELTIPFRPDPQSIAADRELVWEAVGRLPAGTGQGPDIVFVVLDTVRADHLELYGYPHSTMPALTAWAEQGLVYDRVSSTSSWTLPSHASMFTGQYPSSHGAHGRTVEEGHLRSFETGRRAARVLERPLAEESVTLAERLWDAGYTTIGIAANRAFLDRTWQLDQGFDIWICEDADRGWSFLPYTRADRVTAMALEAVDASLPLLEYPEQAGRAPLFLFVNYMEAHGPYVPREGYVRDSSALVWRARTGREREQIARRVLTGKHDLPRDVRAGWLEAYDAELRFLDEQLALLLDGLEERGIGPDAHIVVVSDHGEYFGEQRLLAHSKDVYQPALHVPLIVRSPGVSPGRSDEPVQVQDLAHSLVQVAGAEPLPAAEPTLGMQVAELYGSRGRDLRNKRYGHRFNRVRRAFIQGERKIILGSDGSFEAYDLGQDPAESEDRSAESWALELADGARAWMTLRGIDDAVPADEGEEPELSEEQIEALRALGYVE